MNKCRIYAYTVMLLTIAFSGIPLAWLSFGNLAWTEVFVIVMEMREGLIIRLRQR